MSGMIGGTPVSSARTLLGGLVGANVIVGVIVRGGSALLGLRASDPRGREPMRISIDARDPGFRAYAEACDQGITFNVTLDGERVRSVHTADDLTGEVIVPARDAGGHIMRDPRQPGEILLETRRGRVRIVRRHRHWTDDSSVI